MSDYGSNNDEDEHSDYVYESESEEDMEQSSSKERDDKEYKHMVLTTGDVLEHMMKTIKEVSIIFQIPQTAARILLTHFKWDKQCLCDRYYENEDNHKQLLQDANIIIPINSDSSSSTFKDNNNNNKRQKVCRQKVSNVKVECSICFSDNQTNDMISIACGHNFCKECWMIYLTTKIMEEGQGSSISCAAYGCNILVDDEIIFQLINDPIIICRYKQLITNDFVQCNRLFRWCPKPECGHAVLVEYVGFEPVRCVCNTTFCFMCGKKWHYPLECDRLAKWLKKCSDESETYNWIAANTKDCPKCMTPIEKNGGCNHMWCRNATCKFEFCWICMEDWNQHGYKPCNRYNQDGTSIKEIKDPQRARILLDRYLFYYNRYMVHYQSLQFESELYEYAKQKMEEMQKATQRMTWVELQFINKAVDILVSCRQTLMYTYAFAYYLKKNNRALIFEDNQKDLESSVEELSEFLERDNEKLNTMRKKMVYKDPTEPLSWRPTEHVQAKKRPLSKINEKVSEELDAFKLKPILQDKYNYCESRRKALIELVKEGYDNDTWEYHTDELESVQL